MANLDIRASAAGNGVRFWQIAERMGIHDSALSRKLRKELPQTEKDRIFRIIDELAKEVD